MAKRKRKIERRNRPLTSWDIIGGIAPNDGSPVTAILCENLSATFACVQCISEAIATLPPIVYRLQNDGKQPDPVHPVARLLDQPNEHQTRVEFFEMMQAHLLLRGNAYAEIVRDNRGAPSQLLPVSPDRVSIYRIPNTLTLLYDVYGLDGGVRRLVADEIFHIKDRSDDGLIGKSRLHRAREAFSTAEATERFAASTYRNSAKLSGVLSHPDIVGPNALKNLKTSFVDQFSGPDKAASVMVMEEGMKWTPISVSPEDAELLGSRRFTVETISRLFRVPPPIIGHMENASYSNSVEMSKWFYQQCVAPWLARWETAIEKQLFSEAGRRDHEVEFDTDLLLRGDMLSRYQSYRIAREIGLFSANEIRKFENLNPRSDADANAYLSPLNMQSEQSGAPKA